MSCTERNHAAILPTVVATAATVIGLLWAATYSAHRDDAAHGMQACRSALAAAQMHEGYCSPPSTADGVTLPATWPVVLECDRRNDTPTLVRQCVEATLGEPTDRPHGSTPDAPVWPAISPIPA